MLKKLYRKIIKSLENSIFLIHIIKTWLFEWISIIKKSKQYKNITWTTEQQKRFDDFWILHYGKKISNRWHKLYQSINGIFDESYFPEILYTTRLEPKLNKFRVAQVLEDKSLVEILYGAIPEIYFPKTIILNCSGFYYDNDRNPITKEIAIRLLKEASEIAIKPIIGSSSGSGVRILKIPNEIIQKDNIKLRKLLRDYSKDFIVQEKLEQNSILSRLYKDSINTIRITTYILKDNIYHMPICLRVGTNGRKVDNIHAGGIGIGLSDTGILNAIGYDNNHRQYRKHPNTKMVFQGYQIPLVQEVIQAAYKAHCKTPHIGIVSWDFMIDKKEHIILIESNLIGQGIWFPQILNGYSAFGDKTGEILKLIIKERS